ncbi:MAG: DUF2062 domain-containing protein [Puniceicoccaceae bacterium]|nr:MAG: DUF2062 domain-containing protein [Puniceicoccaceae bacterium]
MTAEQREREERWLRIRRTKFLLRKLPRKANLHRYPILKWFAAKARKHPELWSFRVEHMAPAFYAGCMLAFLPAYGFQVALAFFAALLFKANLPVIVGLQFISNPFTLVPVYYATYKVGNTTIHFLGLGEMTSVIGSTAYALVLGGLLVGAVVGAVLDLVYRFLAWQGARRGLIRPRAVP